MLVKELAIVAYGPPETVDLPTLYDAAPVSAVHVNTTLELPAEALRPTGADGAGSTGVALTCEEFELTPAEFAAETT